MTMWVPIACGTLFLLATGTLGTPLAPQGESVYAKVADSVFVLTATDDAGSNVATGTGFAIEADVLLTNAHVMNAGHVSVQLGPVAVPCEMQRVDPVNDLALCRVQAKANINPLKFASDDPKPGSTIYAIGNPRGLERTISQGLFTGYREIDGRRIVQVSAPISPGSSGGPIVNDNGDVVGVAVATLPNSQNLNFAVPLGVVRQFLLNRESTFTASELVEAVRRLARERDEATFSTEPDSAWQRTDKLFVDQFNTALKAAKDPTLIQQLFDVVASDFWHRDLMLAAAQQAVSRTPRPDRLAYSNLARALYFTNTNANPTLMEAEKAALKAVELGLAKNVDDLILLGDVQQAKGDNHGAYGVYRKAEALTKGDASQAVAAYIGLFQTSRDLGRPTEADQWFAKAKKAPDLSFLNWAEYAAFLSDTGRHADSAAAYVQAFQLARMVYSYACEAGREYFLADLPDEALRAERTCIEVASSKPKSEAAIQSAHRIIAAILNERGVYDEAASHAKEAIQLDSSDPWAHYQLAKALNSLRRFTEALNEAKAALRLSDGKYAEMHFQLGSAHFELKQWTEAQQAYQKAAEMDPKDPTAAYNVAVSYYNQAYYSEALNWYREVLRRDPRVRNLEQVQRMIDKLSSR